MHIFTANVCCRFPICMLKSNLGLPVRQTSGLITGVMKRAVCCWPRKRQPLTEKSAMVDVDGTFQDQLYGKKCSQINLEIIKRFKILSFWSTFGINTCFRFSWQNYNKKSKFWKINKKSFYPNRLIIIPIIV